MKKNNTMTVVIIFVGVFIFLFLLFLPSVLKAQLKQPEIKHYIEYIDPINYVNDDPRVGPDAFYGTGYVDDPEKYRKEVAPLTKERFIRRIKMLFGVDITDHYDNKGHCYMTPTIAVFPESQLVKIRQVNEVPSVGGIPKTVQIQTIIKELEEEYGEDFSENELFQPYRALSFSDIVLYCKWAFYNDMDAYRIIKQGDDNCKRLHEYEGVPTEVQHIIARHRYAAPFDCRDSLPHEISLAEFVPQLGVALRGDVGYINTLNTIGRYRAFNNIAETENYKLDFDIVGMLLERHYRATESPAIVISRPNSIDVHYMAMPPIDSLRYSCYTMGILPSLNRYMTVPEYVNIMSNSVAEFLRKQKAEFEEYNYFGHTLLRDLAKGRKIDNSKVGVPYTATVVGPTAMRIDPYDIGIEFDTLHVGELFTVYEMGYDDYYLVQCAKPLEEWNVHDENGYAKCTGRMERVWCYVPKKDMNIIPHEKATMRPFIDWGITSNADGYVNLHSRDDITDRIPAGTWVKIISYDMKNYLIETVDGRKGQIQKTSIIW